MSKSPLPTGEQIPQTRLEHEFCWRTVTPHGQVRLAFKAFIPNRYLEVPVPKTEDHQVATGFATLAIFQDESTGSAILVQRQPLPREVAAAHWLRLVCAQTGRKIEILNAISPHFAEASVSFQSEGSRWSGRMAVQITGKAAVLLSGVSPAAVFEGVHAEFGMFLATWEFLSSPVTNEIEQRAQAKLGDLSFQIPVSWKKASTPQQFTRNALAYANLDDHGELNGLIRVAVGRLDPAKGWLAGLDDAFAFWTALDLPQSKPMLQAIPDVQAEGINKASLLIVLLSDEGSSSATFEGWLLAVETESGWATVSMLTPPESDAEKLHVWAFNNRAFKIVCETLAVDSRTKNPHAS